jgi:predicted 2-oxoglutarate/Fe(II)-dependent dioxygenase YbiX
VLLQIPDVLSTEQVAHARRLLDAADLLLAIGGRSKDRKCYNPTTSL